MKLAFLVSTYNDPDNLLCCLASLALQKTNKEFTIEVHVADNGELNSHTESICKFFPNVTYHKTKGDCYIAAEALAPSIKADWLCFASSDSYYVPGFSLTMLEVAVRLGSDFVYCDCLYDPRLHGRGIYSVMSTFPEMRWIDKTCFILKKKLFKGFPPHKNDWRDGALVESLVKKKFQLDKAKGVLVVHN